MDVVLGLADLEAGARMLLKYLGGFRAGWVILDVSLCLLGRSRKE